MDIFSIHTEIKKRLIEKRPDLLKAFEDAPKGASTGGEGLGMTMSFFKNLKKNDSNGFAIITDLVDEYVKECKERYGIKYEI